MLHGDNKEEKDEKSRTKAKIIQAFFLDDILGERPPSTDCPHFEGDGDDEVSNNDLYLFEGPMLAAWTRSDFAPASSPRFWIAVYHCHFAAGDDNDADNNENSRRFTTWFFRSFAVSGSSLSTAKLRPYDVETIACMLVDLRRDDVATTKDTKDTKEEEDDAAAPAARIFVVHLHGTPLGAKVLAAIAATPRGGLELTMYLADTFHQVRLPPNVVFQAFRQLRPDMVRMAVQRGMRAAGCSAAFLWWLDYQRPPTTPLSAEEEEMNNALRCAAVER